MTAALPGVRSPESEVRASEASLFSESASRVVVSASPEDLEALMSKAAAAGVPATVIGKTGGSRIAIDVDGKRAIDLSVEEAETIWSTAIERYFA